MTQNSFQRNIHDALQIICTKIATKGYMTFKVFKI